MSTDNMHSQQDVKPSREKISLGKEASNKIHMTPIKVKNRPILKSPTKVAQNQYKKTLNSLDQVSTSMLKLDLQEQNIINQGAFGTSTKIKGGGPKKIFKNIKRDAMGNFVLSPKGRVIKEQENNKITPKQAPNLPKLKMSNYRWNGDLSKLLAKTKEWEKFFGNCNDAEIVPQMRKLIPQEYHYIINNIWTFQGCLNKLKAISTGESIYTEQLKYRIKHMPKSYSLKTDKVIINSYLRAIYQLLDIDITSIMSPVEIQLCFAKLSCAYTFHKIKDTLEELKIKHADPQGIKNYIFTFRDLLEDTLHQTNDAINTQKTLNMQQYSNNTRKNQVTSKFNNMALEHAGLAIGGHFGHQSNRKQGAPKLVFQNVKKDYLGNIIFNSNGHPQFRDSDRFNPPRKIKTTNQNNQNMSNNSVKKLWPCLQCNKIGHRNLVKCTLMASTLKKSRDIPKNICQICLETALENPNIDCKHHLSNKNFKKQICPISKKHFLVCQLCGNCHMKAVNWFKSKHDPLRGFKNYNDCKFKASS